MLRPGCREGRVLRLVESADDLTLDLLLLLDPEGFNVTGSSSSSDLLADAIQAFSVSFSNYNNHLLLFTAIHARKKLVTKIRRENRSSAKSKKD